MSPFLFYFAVEGKKERERDVSRRDHGRVLSIARYTRAKNVSRGSLDIRAQLP